ncbi:MAG: ABC transporter permease [Wolinella sp.]
MRDSIVPYLTRCYLRFDRTQPFISITALLAFFGVAIGVMVLLVAMAIMNGFSKELERKLFTMNYPLTIYPKIQDSISESLLIELEERFPHLIFSPFLRTQGISKVRDQLEGAIIFGVDFEREKRVNSVVAEALGKESAMDKFDIIIGKELKNEFLLERDSKLMLIFTQLEPTGLSLSPTMKRFNVRGFFHSGLSAYDKGYIFAPLSAISTIKKQEPGVYDGIHVYTKEPMSEIENIRDTLPLGAGIIGWWQQNGNFFAALALEKRALFIVLMLIILIASLNIISSLLMTVMNRRREIALLLSLGASQREIKQIFFRLGNTIGLSGIILGVLLAWLALWILGTFPIISLPADVYGDSKLPLDLSLFDFVATLLGSIVVVLLSSYYPAHQATKIDPLNVLRNE